MLKIENLHVSYGITEVLKGIDIFIPKGTIVALLGGNGSGKTTTLNTISGFLRPKAGAIEFEGVNINGLSTDVIVKMGIVQIPQGREIFSGLTVQENLEMGAVTRKDKYQIKRDIVGLFDQFPILKDRKNQKAGFLSGGEQQMLSIARALMAQPKLLLMDEPSAGLSPIIAKEIAEIIKNLNHSSKTILLVEHNIHLALSLAKTGYVLREGKIALSGRANTLRESKEIIESYLRRP